MTGHGGYRFQYQTKRLWRQIVQHTRKTQETVLETLESGIAALGLLDVGEEEDEEDDDLEERGSNSRTRRRTTIEMGTVN